MGQAFPWKYNATNKIYNKINVSNMVVIRLVGGVIHQSIQQGGAYELFYGCCKFKSQCAIITQL